MNNSISESIDYMYHWIREKSGRATPKNDSICPVHDTLLNEDNMCDKCLEQNNK
jgi:hypothetical protein